MFEYMTAQEAAEKWNVSLRWVQRLCKGNRIEGVIIYCKQPSYNALHLYEYVL